MYMYATHPLMMIDACFKYGKAMSNQKTDIGRTQKHVKKPFKFDLEIKGQRCIGIINLSNTLSRCGTTMCQMW